jgi:aspartyl-tRNA(Asn)/glutamyl-tRNA(Gln) amidotransferase subunit B
MTELPRAMAKRFAADYGLSDYDATALTQSRATADYFENCVKASGPKGDEKQSAKLAANWILGELSANLNAAELDIDHSPLGPFQMASIIQAVNERLVSNSRAKDLFRAIWASEKQQFESAAAAFAQILRVIDEKNLGQLNDSGALEKIVDEVLAANPKNVEQYKAGNTKALNALVGQIMKGSQGKANPQQVNDLLRAKLG